MNGPYALTHRPLALSETFALAPRRLQATPKAALIGGVAAIPIDGLLAAGVSDPKEGVRGYGDIRLEYLSALQAEDAAAVALLVNSPGGFVEGCFDLAELIYVTRGIKPVHAIVCGEACSAAYLLASAADIVTVPRTGHTGSIGIVMIHTEASEAMGKAGVKNTIVRSGPQKMDVNGLEPLTAEALGRMQSEVDELAAMFIDTVARNRGMAAEDVRATEGAVIFGPHGVEAGFADEVMAPDAAFRRLLPIT